MTALECFNSPYFYLLLVALFCVGFLAAGFVDEMRNRRK